jgi:putative transposase
MLVYCGINVSDKTVHEWAEKFGRSYANVIRRRLLYFGEKWHLDEVVISINSKRHFL